MRKQTAGKKKRLETIEEEQNDGDRLPKLRWFFFTFICEFFYFLKFAIFPLSVCLHFKKVFNFKYNFKL